MSPDADAPDGRERMLDELLQRASDSAQSSLENAIDVEARLRELHLRAQNAGLEHARAFTAYLNELSSGDRWAHCGNARQHDAHSSVVSTNEAAHPVVCVGTPTLDDASEPEGSERVWSEDELAEMRRATRPGSQPLPVPNQREGAHDALLREHLEVAVHDRKMLGLTRYHSLLQAGNGRDSLRDAQEEVLDLAAYVQVWRQARDEALSLLSELRVALVNQQHYVGESRTRHVEENVAKIREVEHLLGGGTSG